MASSLMEPDRRLNLRGSSHAQHTACHVDVPPSGVMRRLNASITIGQSFACGKLRPRGAPYALPYQEHSAGHHSAQPAPHVGDRRSPAHCLSRGCFTSIIQCSNTTCNMAIHWAEQTTQTRQTKRTRQTAKPRGCTKAPNVICR